MTLLTTERTAHHAPLNALHLRFSRAPSEHTLQRLVDYVLAHFPTHES